jgi:hypothetical protein
MKMIVIATNRWPRLHWRCGHTSSRRGTPQWIAPTIVDRARDGGPGREAVEDQDDVVLLGTKRDCDRVAVRVGCSSAEIARRLEDAWG